MTAVEKAIELLEGHPFYNVLVEYVATKATRYTQAKIIFDKRLGASSGTENMIRDAVFDALKQRHVR